MDRALAWCQETDKSGGFGSPGQQGHAEIVCDNSRIGMHKHLHVVAIKSEPGALQERATYMDGVADNKTLVYALQDDVDVLVYPRGSTLPSVRRMKQGEFQVYNEESYSNAAVPAVRSGPVYKLRISENPADKLEELALPALAPWYVATDAHASSHRSGVHHVVYDGGIYSCDYASQSRVCWLTRQGRSLCVPTADVAPLKTLENGDVCPDSYTSTLSPRFKRTAARVSVLFHGKQAAFTLPQGFEIEIGGDDFPLPISETVRLRIASPDSASVDGSLTLMPVILFLGSGEVHVEAAYGD